MAATNGLTQTCSIDGSGPFQCGLDVRHNRIEVTPLVKFEPDPSWSTVDINNHYHAFDNEGELPTLRKEKGKYRCIVCGARVRPAYHQRSPIGREYLPGLEDWSIMALIPMYLVSELAAKSDVTRSVVAAHFDGSMMFGFAILGSIVSSASDVTFANVTFLGASRLGRRHVNA